MDKNNLSKWGEVVKAYEIAIKLDPKLKNSYNIERAVAWTNMGIYLVTLGKTDDALIAFNKSIDINSKLPDTWNNKGLVLEIIGKNREAFMCFREAAKLDPNDYYAWNNTGNALRRLGRTIEANEAFAEAQKLASMPKKVHNAPP